MALEILTVLAGAKTGGAETFFVTLTTALQRSGLAVRSVLKPNTAREAALTGAGVAFDTAPFRSFLDFTTSAILRRAIAAFAPQVVLAFAGRAASFAPLGAHTLIGRLGGYYNLKNFRRCDHLVCNTPDLVRYVRNGGFAQNRVHFIPNFPMVPPAPPVDRASLQTPKDVPLAVALGRLHPSKGLDVLLRAMTLLPELWLWIAGEGPEGAHLEALAQELGVAPRVRFLGWREDRGALYAAADVVAYPSREEPFGNVIVEAWACGVPIVTAAATGPAWMVRDGQDAILTPVGDADALAAGIKSVLASKDFAAKLIEAGRARVTSEFSEAAIVRRYTQLFESVRR